MYGIPPPSPKEVQQKGRNYANQIQCILPANGLINLGEYPQAEGRGGVVCSTSQQTQEENHLQYAQYSCSAIPFYSNIKTTAEQ
jgi:hypothetical protein